MTESKVPGSATDAPARTPDQQHRDDLSKMEPSTGESLKEQRDLIDQEGDDIREYTGEPVETEEGWVVPQQQNAGTDNIAGGGEWPDRDTPPVQPAPED